VRTIDAVLFAGILWTANPTEMRALANTLELTTNRSSRGSKQTIAKPGPVEYIVDSAGASAESLMKVLDASIVIAARKISKRSIFKGELGEYSRAYVEDTRKEHGYLY
jgi:hypothetical protein